MRKTSMCRTLGLCRVAPLTAALVFLAGCGSPPTSELTGQNLAPQGPAAPPKHVRLGYFANITHAQALIGVARGDFQRALSGSTLDAKVFNAGPSVVEAFFAGELDLAYIGPSPALNAYVKSNGKAVRIISGSAANGVVIVARKDSGINRIEDLKGRRVATPQFGNTQDISARVYLTQTLHATLNEKGGDTEIVTVANAEQMGLFKAGQIDASWVPEPWGARMVQDAGAVIVAEEKDLWPDRRFCSAVVLVSTKFLQEYPAAVEAFLRTHAEITHWVREHRDDAAPLANAELKRLCGKALPESVLREAFARIEFTTDPLEASVRTFEEKARGLGMLKAGPDLKNLFAFEILEKLRSEGLAP